MNKIYSLITIISIVFAPATYAQVGIGTTSPDPSAQLEITATDKGMLVPRMNAAQRDAIATPATGLMIYNTDDNAFWYYNGTRWVSVVNSGIGPDTTTFVGNTVTPPSPNLISILHGSTSTDTSGIILDSGGDMFNYTNNENYSVYLDGWAFPNLIGYRFYVEYAIAGGDSLILQDFSTGRIIAAFTNQAFTTYDTVYSHCSGIRVIFKSNSSGVNAGFKLTYNRIYDAGAGGAEPSVTGPWYYRPASNAIAGGLNGAPNSSRVMGEHSFSYGMGTDATGHYSIAMGNQNIASGKNAVAMGMNNLVSGHYSSAFGRDFVVSGDYSSAFGRKNKALNLYSFAAGYENVAGGAYSTAFGSNNLAFGEYSASFGAFSKANGDLSTVMGHGTISKHFASLVIGRYNDTTSGPTSRYTWISTDPIFIVGNGLPSSRSNALTLYKNGNMTIAGTLTQNSDARLKRNIHPLTGVMDKLLQLNGYQYNWATHYSDNEELNTGLLAQEIEKVMPELIHRDGSGTMSVNYSGMIPYLLEAIKTLKAEVEMLKNR